jgi:hypothetical protein
MERWGAPPVVVVLTVLWFIRVPVQEIFDDLLRALIGIIEFCYCSV